jgi:hypothetical protein
LPARPLAATVPTSALLLLLALAACAGAGRSGREVAELPGWSVELAALLPAINACVSEADASAVTRAWGMARSLAGVRVVREDGSRVDCVASDAGDKVVLVQPVAAGSHLDDEAAPLYTPPDHRPPQGRCVATIPAVVSARQVGWLSYGTCPRRAGATTTAAPPPSAPAEGRRPSSSSLPPAV